MSEKINFKIGDRVMMIQNSKPLYGVIQTLSSNGYETIAIVSYATEKPGEYELIKRKVSDIILAEDIENTKSEPIGESAITITEDKFQDIGVDIVKKLSGKFPHDGIVYTLFLADLHKALFFGEVNENP